MCRIDNDDSDYDTLVDERWPVAAWPHHCMDCRRTIERDEKYLRQVWGTYWEEEECLNPEDLDFVPESERDRCLTEMCAHCVAAGVWLNAVCGGHMWPGVGEELEEHQDESDLYRSEGLRLLVDGWYGRWHSDGVLIPVATVEQWVSDALVDLARRKMAVSAA
jgi:hypothetical protein